MGFDQTTQDNQSRWVSEGQVGLAFESIVILKRINILCNRCSETYKS